MLEFNVGELATRLRRALGVRGRMPLGLDEHVIPVTLTADVNCPPWRTNPVHAEGAAVSNWSNLASADYVLAGLEFPLTAAVGPASVFVVTGYTVQPVHFVTATGASIPNVANAASGHFRPNGRTLPTVAGSTQALITTERADAVGTSLVPYQLPLLTYGSRTSATPSTSGRFNYVRAGLVQPPVFIPCQIALRPGQALEWYHEAQLADLTWTVGVTVTVQGLYYGLGG